jgi:PAS domain S-box-containing protein
MVRENPDPDITGKGKIRVQKLHNSIYSLNFTFLIHLGGVILILLVFSLFFYFGCELTSSLTSLQLQMLSLILVCFVIITSFILLNLRNKKFRKEINEMNKTIEFFEERLNEEDALRISEEKFRTLNQMISEMILLRDTDSIFKFITDSLHRRYPDCIILYNSIDEENGIARFESASGLNNNILKEIISLTGFNPLGRDYRLTALHEKYLRQGKLLKFSGTLEEFSRNEFPGSAAQEIDNMVDLSNIYTIGINKGEKIFASLLFFALKNSSITDNEFVEAFVRHAAIIIQKRLAEIALKESEERLLTIVEGSLDAIIAIDVNGNIAVFNGQARALFQYTEEEALQKPASLIMRDEIREIHQVWLDRYLKKGSGNCQHFGKRIEKVFRKKDGSIFTAEISMSESRNDDLSLIVFSIHDITERKNAENALKDSEQRFSLFMNHLPAIAFITDNTGNLIYANKAMNESVGAYENNSDVFKKTSLIRGIDKALMTTGYIITEDSVMNLDGNVHDYEIYRFIIKRDGRSDLVGAIALDITQRKIVENKLKESENTARTMVDSSERLSILIDVADSSIIDLNEFSALALGKSMDELIGKDAFSYMPDDSSGTRLKKIRDVIITRKPSSFQDERGGKYFQNNVYPISDSKGEIRRLAVFAQEITEIKIVEEQLKQLNMELLESNATKDKLISIIAHDLRSPFSSILGFSELLGENFRYYDIKKTEKIIEIINSSAKHTLSLLDNLLTWARMQQGQFDFKPEAVEMGPLVKEVTDMLNSSARFKSIRIRYISDYSTSVYADVNMLKTILRNLVQNSIKFSKPGGHIEVSSEVKGGQVVIAVSDEGIGMEKETINNLFRIGSSTPTKGTANETGSGWGLIICKEFIEMHKGKMEIESTPGHGTTFRFNLPFYSKD